MAYIRKTKEVYVLLSNYGYGWEEELEEDTKKGSNGSVEDISGKLPTISIYH